MDCDFGRLILLNKESNWVPCAPNFMFNAIQQNHEILVSRYNELLFELKCIVLQGVVTDTEKQNSGGFYAFCYIQ